VIDGEDQFSAALGDAFADRGLAETVAAPDEGTPAEASTDYQPADPPPPVADDGQLRDEQGRYTSAREIEEKLTLLEKRLADKDEFIGRQASELGQLREGHQRLEQQLQYQAQPQYDYDDLIAENPAQAAMAAYEQGDSVALQRAAAAWDEVAPGAPAIWVQGIQREQQLRAEIEQIRQTQAPVQQHYQSVQHEQASTNAVTSLLSAYEDFGAYAPTILQQLEGSPSDQAKLASGNEATIRETMELHYFRAKMRAGDTLNEAATNHAQQAAEASRNSKLRLRLRLPPPLRLRGREQVLSTRSKWASSKRRTTLGS
jgi:hypothetical protein